MKLVALSDQNTDQSTDQNTDQTTTMPNLSKDDKEILEMNYGLQVLNTREDGTCAPASIGTCYGKDMVVVMEECSKAFDGKTELCTNVLSFTRTDAIPPSMVTLLDSYVDTPPVISLPRMLKEVKTIGDTNCYYWWDTHVLEVYCDVNDKNIVLFSYHSETKTISVYRLFRAGSSTFTILLHNVDHFMPCSIGGSFEFDLHDIGGFRQKAPVLANLIDPRNERWFLQSPVVQDGATDAGDAGAVAVGGASARESTDYIVHENVAFDKEELVVISFTSVKGITPSTAQHLFSQHMVALAQITEKNHCSQFLSCKILAYKDGFEEFFKSDMCCDKSTDLATDHTREDLLQMMYVHLATHEGIIFIDALYIHGLSFMAQYNSTRSSEKKRKIEQSRNHQYLSKKEVSLTAYIDDLNMTLTNESFTKLYPGNVRYIDDRYIWNS